MRPAFLAMLLALFGCATSAVDSPSLAPRPAEAIDPRLPVEEPAPPANANPQLAGQLNALIAQAIAGDEAFRSAADKAERLAAAAGPPQSESWIVAQQALAAAIAAREPVTSALGDIDALGAERINRLGGIAAADLAAINAAAARVAEIDEREASVIARIQAMLAS